MKASKASSRNTETQYLALLERIIAQGAQREERLLAMMQVVIDEKFFRPVVTSDKAGPKLVSSSYQLDDVAEFDVESDQKMIEQHEMVDENLQNEFRSIFTEQMAAHHD